MKLTIDILTSIALLMWPLQIMMAPMLIGAPGADRRPSNLLLLFVILFYPTAIFATYVACGAGSYFGLRSLTALAWSGGLGCLAALLYRYPRLVFNAVMGIPNDGFFVSDGAVFYDGKRLRGIHRASFAALDADPLRYAKDARQVYFSGRILAGADPATFIRLRRQGDGGDSIFWRDDRRVYTDGNAMDGADPDTFVALDGCYGRDARHVYDGARAIAGADIHSFQVLSPCIAKDRNAVYVFGQRSDVDIDAATFELLTGAFRVYGKDRFRVYALFDRSLTILTGATPDGFTLLEEPYMKDRGHVYYMNSCDPIADADVASFEVISHDAQSRADAKDKHRHYRWGAPVGEAKDRSTV